MMRVIRRLYIVIVALLFAPAIIPFLKSSWWLRPYDFLVANNQAVFVRDVVDWWPFPIVARWEQTVVSVNGSRRCEATGVDVYEPRPDRTVTDRLTVWLGRECTAPGFYVWHARWRVLLLGIPARPVEMTRVVEVPNADQ